MLKSFANNSGSDQGKTEMNAYFGSGEISHTNSLIVNSGFTAYLQMFSEKKYVIQHSI